MATAKTMTLAELKQTSLDAFFQSLTANKQVITVTLPDGNEVIIQSKPELKPLPLLQGTIPEGWKEAIYDGSK